MFRVVRNIITESRYIFRMETFKISELSTLYQKRSKPKQRCAPSVAYYQAIREFVSRNLIFAARNARLIDNSNRFTKLSRWRRSFANYITTTFNNSFRARAPSKPRQLNTNNHSLQKFSSSPSLLHPSTPPIWATQILHRQIQNLIEDRIQLLLNFKTFFVCEQSWIFLKFLLNRERNALTFLLLPHEHSSPFHLSSPDGCLCCAPYFAHSYLWLSFRAIKHRLPPWRV